MCGIAGLIWKGKSSNIGSEMTSMLQALKHRGPDSTGFALYGNADKNQYVMRFITAEQEAMKSGFDIQAEVEAREEAVEARLKESGAKINEQHASTDYSHRYTFSFDGDMRRLID